jgi:5'-methylthioadenosine phosphorylase
LETVHIGVIGGSGLYDMAEITDKVEYDLDTPFGKPSAPVTVGTLHGQRVAFLPRHGVGHIYTPTTVPYRANIYAMKLIGVRFLIAVSACGSLQEPYAPGHFLVPDQLYDNTKSDRRGRSFFDTGLVAHAGVADPFEAYVAQLIHESLETVGGTSHLGGLFVTIEGPRFSTKGESRTFRQWGCDIIGMTTSPEAFLAAEAEIAYACMAHITDYDVWHNSEEPVTVEAVMKTVGANVATAKKAVAELVQRINTDEVRPVHDNLKYALTTHPDAVSTEMRERLDTIVSKYL